VLEVLALSLGCAVLGYVTCREKDPEAGRAGRVFAAPRAEGAAASTPERAAIEGLLGNTLRGIATGSLSEEKRVDIQRELMALLEQAGIGRPESRSNAAALIVQQMFDRAKLEIATSELSTRQRQAITAMARELTRQISLLAVGASPGADAMATTLPDGVLKLNWKHMGGFQYVEGGEVPADIRALDGRSVGVPGFILTMGDTENIREFILLESLWGCCFGAVPDVNQTILVRLGSGGPIDYTAAPVLVTGKLEVGEERQGGFVASLYRVVDAKVQPLAL
jgi:hypothetical protein